jgi:acetyl esterase/lipase
MATITRRDFAAISTAAAVTLASGSKSVVAATVSTAAAPTGVDPLLYVHAELRPAILQFKQLYQAQPSLAADFSAANLTQRRNAFKSFGAPPLAQPSFAERTVSGPKGAPDVQVYVINAVAGMSRPAILHTHGGGYVSGAAANSLHDLQELAVALDCVIVTVDYRLAPETRFPGSLEDNYAALRWLHVNAEELGADRKRIAVMGESAGGGHAAILAIAARDRGEVPLAFQSLIYPMLDDRTGSSRSMPAHVGQYIWTAGSNRFGWESFLGRRPGGSSAPTGAVPARLQNLAGLPPAFIGVGGIDLFVYEDIEYAQRLIAAGVATELQVVPGAFHGFDAIAKDTSLSRQFTAAKIEALRRAFKSTDTHV